MNEDNFHHASGSVRDNVLVVTILAQRIADPDTSYALRDEILSMVDSANASQVVLDFQQVHFMGSVGVLALMAVRRRLKGGQVVLCNVSGAVREMFEVCRLIAKDASENGLFEAADSLETALARFTA